MVHLILGMLTGYYGVSHSLLHCVKVWVIIDGMVNTRSTRCGHYDGRTRSAYSRYGRKAR